MIPRRTLLAAAALAPLAGCATAPKAKTPTELKLVTFNIWHNMGDWAARRPLLVAALTGTRPDVRRWRTLGMPDVIRLDSRAIVDPG